MTKMTGTDSTADAIIDRLDKQSYPYLMAKEWRQVLVQDIAEALRQVERETLERAAKLCEKPRCRDWNSKECAAQIRAQLKSKIKVICGVCDATTAYGSHACSC